MNNHDDSQIKANNRPPPADAELVAELLADLPIELGAEPEPLTPADLGDLGVTVSAHFAAVEKGRKKRDKEYEAKGKEIRARSAAAARKQYEERTGRPPRPYEKRNLAPQQHQLGETPDEHRRRTKRERMHIYRGVTAEQIEARAVARQAMTPEARKAKKAAGEAARRAKMTPEQKKAEAKRKQDKRAANKKQEVAEAAAKLKARAIF